jgi:FHS family L-fucose permease-like MFS transporter
LQPQLSGIWIKVKTSLCNSSGNWTPIFSKRYLGAFVLITSLYFLWGVPANLNDLLVRQFMKSFELSRFHAGLLQSAFYLGYFCFSIPAP